VERDKVPLSFYTANCIRFVIIYDTPKDRAVETYTLTHTYTQLLSNFIKHHKNITPHKSITPKSILVCFFLDT